MSRLTNNKINEPTYGPGGWGSLKPTTNPLGKPGAQLADERYCVTTEVQKSGFMWLYTSFDFDGQKKVRAEAWDKDQKVGEAWGSTRDSAADRLCRQMAEIGRPIHYVRGESGWTPKVYA